MVYVGKIIIVSKKEWNKKAENHIQKYIIVVDNAVINCVQSHMKKYLEGSSELPTQDMKEGYV